MQNILAKIGAFFEAHVEKIVLIIAGILGLWLLMVFVVMSPNSVSYDNTSFSPGSIDTYVYEKKARFVQDELNQSSTASGTTYSSKLTSPIDVTDPVLDGFKTSLPEGFMGLLSCSINHIDSGVSRVRPVNETEIKADGRQYALPYVGRVTQVQIGHIRAAAYMPFEVVTDESDYQSVDHEVNDVDLVTVQARYDLASLRARFYDSFSGGSLNAEWRDERLAKPVFAAVNLQRREPLPDTTWSPWADVRHIATLPRSETYSLIENVSDLPAGGVRLRMIRLNEEAVRTNILQPPAYEMASTYEEWLPPEFHGKYVIERQKEISQKRREERESERKQRDTGSTRGRTRGGLTSQQGGRNSAMGTEGRRGRRGSTSGNDRNSMSGARNSRTGNDRNSRRGVRGGNARGGVEDMYAYDASMQGVGGMQKASPLDAVFQAFEEIRLSPMKDFDRLDEIVFWAHDDSMEPGKQYQYRIRLGVLNPVAGLGQVSQKDSDFKDQVILWSDFSTQTELVGIPQRLYFFANTFQEVSNAASIEVAKFDDGYWRSSIFSVKPGEVIGRPVEIELEEDKNDPMYSSRQMRPGGLFEPEPLLVDFTTNVVFVGAEKVNKWLGGKNLRSQVAYHMLCSVNGQDLQRVPIGAKNWPRDLFSAYGVIKKLQKEPIEDYRSFGSSRASSESSRYGAGGNMDIYGY